MPAPAATVVVVLVVDVLIGVVVHVVLVNVVLVGRRRVIRVVGRDLVLDHVAGDLGRVEQRRVGLHQRLEVRVQERLVVVRRDLAVARL